MRKRFVAVVACGDAHPQPGNAHAFGQNPDVEGVPDISFSNHRFLACTGWEIQNLGCLQKIVRIG